jgi:hypothetical protein
MPRVPKATDGATTKKGVSKPNAEAANGTKVAQEAKVGSKTTATLEMPCEEQIRIRAYELYLQREGQGGSPEQDWFRAVAEVYGESVA